MNFEEVWQQYDFTESELLSMGWQFPYDYVLNLNYYWQLNPTNSTSEVATNDQFLNIILKTCIRLDVQLNPPRYNRRLGASYSLSLVRKSIPFS